MSLLHPFWGYIQLDYFSTKDEAAGSFKTSVNIYQLPSHHIDCFSASTRRIFLELHNPHFTHMHNKTYKFGINQSIITSTSLLDQCTFSTVSRLPLHGFSSKSISRTFLALHNRHCKFRSDRSIITGTLLEPKTFSTVCRLPQDRTSSNFINRTYRVCATSHVSFVLIGQ